MLYVLSRNVISPLLSYVDMHRDTGVTNTNPPCLFTDFFAHCSLHLPCLHLIMANFRS